jgi:ankyrin repeat protein
LEQGADVNAVDTTGETALTKVILGGDLEMITCLLQHGSDIDRAVNLSIYHCPRKPLCAAIETRNKDLIRMLLDSGVSSPTPSSFDKAIRRGNLDVLYYLLDRGVQPSGGHLLRTIDSLPSYPSDTGKEIVRRLLHSQSPIDYNDRVLGTPLVCAIGRDLSDIAQLLLEHSANVNMPPGHRTPLEAAIRKVNVPIVLGLLARGASVTDPRALCAAVTTGDSSILSIILEAVSSSERIYQKDAFHSPVLVTTV